MKSIELTEEHKSKLLGMCKSLFPEYKGGISTHENGFNINQIYLIGFIDENNDYIPNCDLYIHWFEFCSRYLMSKLDNLYIQKILDLVDPYGKSNDYGRGSIKNYPDNWKELWENRIFYQYNINLNGIFPKCHPIDYLYKQFEKLK